MLNAYRTPNFECARCSPSLTPVSDRLSDVTTARRVPSAPAAGSPPPARPLAVDYGAIAASEDYRELRARRRRLAVVGVIAFGVPYMVFVLASVLVPHLMGTPVLGSINLGFLLGFAVIVWTLVLIRWYRTRAARDIDPLVEALRERWEGPR